MNEVEQLAAQAAEDAAKVTPEGTPVEAQAPEGPDPAEVEAEAKRFGWKPREEWKGDASNWTDAPAYLEYARNTPHMVKRIERDYAERLARIEAFNAQALERERKAHAAELEAARRAQREAVSVADPEAWEAARRREDALREAAPARPEPAKVAPPPEVAEWTKRNTWFDTDPEMKSAALALAQKAADAGLGVPAQLAYVEREIATFFPDKVKPQPQRQTFAAVDGGSVAPPAKRGKGWADIPAAEREMIRKHHIGSVYANEGEAAKAYWEMNA